MKPSGNRTRSLRFIIVMAFIILSVFILLNTVLAMVTQDIQSRRYLHLIEVLEKIAEESARAEANLVISGYKMLEFTLWKDESLIASAEEAVKDTDELLEELLHLEDRTENADAAQIQALITTLKTYENLLETYHKQMVEAGLDENSGLQGEFRAAAHELEGLFEELGRDDLTVKYLMLRRHEKDFMLRLADKYITRADGVITELKDDIGFLAIPEEQRQNAVGLLDTYLQAFYRLTGIMVRNNAILLEMDGLANTMYPELEKMAENADIAVSETQVEIARLRNILSAINVSFVLVSLAIAVILGIVVYQRMSRPMSVILSVTDDMADGRLDSRAGLTRLDEMGRIGANIDRAGKTLAELVGTIKTAVDDGMSLSDRLGSMAEETAAAITEVTANIDSINKRTDDMNSTAKTSGDSVSGIAERLEDLSRSAEEQSSSVTESTASVEEMVASIQNVNDIAEEKNQAASELETVAQVSLKGVRETGEMVEEIAGLTEKTREAIAVINAVASRTNLLAMNAAIEAAHAGDAGRGFAVVADEIRKLAESTATNAKGINESLGGMITRIAEVKEASASSIDGMEKMTGDVIGFSRSFAEISSSMAEMSIGSREVLNASEALALLTENLNRAIEEMKTESSSVNAGMQEMVNLSVQVSDGVGEIKRASTEINQAASSLSRDGDENRSLMARIKNLADRFRLGDDIEP